MRLTFAIAGTLSAVLLWPNDRASARYEKDASCVQDVLKKYRDADFSNDPAVKFDESDAAKVCELNSAVNANSCLAQIKSKRPYMLAYGVAIVCSGGVSGADAESCLAGIENKISEWRWVVNACAGSARQISKCEPETNSPVCVDIKASSKRTAIKADVIN